MEILLGRIQGIRAIYARFIDLARLIILFFIFINLSIIEALLSK